MLGALHGALAECNGQTTINTINKPQLAECNGQTIFMWCSLNSIKLEIAQLELGLQLQSHVMSELNGTSTTVDQISNIPLVLFSLGLVQETNRRFGRVEPPLVTSYL